jgi:hypothetical protein
MNRLLNTRAYLAGPMEAEPDNGVGWRQRLVAELADLGVCWLDPTDKPTDIAVESLETRQQLARDREEGNYDALARTMKLVRCVDLRLTDIADFLVVHLDAALRTCGTWEEIANANRQKKPVLVHYEQGKANVPLWLYGMLPHQMIFSTWADLYAYLRHIAHDPVIDRLNRWYFFNLSHAESNDEA